MLSFTLREPNLLDATHIAKLHVSTWHEAYSHGSPENFFTDTLPMQSLFRAGLARQGPTGMPCTMFHAMGRQPFELMSWTAGQPPRII